MAPGAYRSGEGWALYVGHARQVLEVLPESSVQTIVTSPPYFNLRDYRGNPDQIGLEPTPSAYVEALVDVFRGAARVLRPDGTLWLNIGDTYSSRANQGRSADRHTGRGHRTGVTAARTNTVSTAPMKSLLLIPSRLALALQEDGWVVRNDVIWHKTKAMPHSVTDRLSNRYEHLLLLTRSQRYYFDLDAIKEPASGRAAGNRRRQAYAKSVGTEAATRRFGINDPSPLSETGYSHRNPGDVWSPRDPRQHRRPLCDVPYRAASPMCRGLDTPRRRRTRPLRRTQHDRPGSPQPRTPIPGHRRQRRRPR